MVLEVVILLPQSSKDVKDSLYSTFTLQKYKKEVSVQNKFKFILEKEGEKQLSGISEHLLFNDNVNVNFSTTFGYLNAYATSTLRPCYKG